MKLTTKPFLEQFSRSAVLGSATEVREKRAGEGIRTLDIHVGNVML